MIEVHHLCKHYGNQKAVDDISFTIEKGHLVADDTPENLEKLFAGNTTIELTARAEDGEIREMLSFVSGIRTISCSAPRPGRNGEPETEVSIETDGNVDIREELFDAFAAVLLLFAGIYTMAICLQSGYSNFEYVLGNIGFIFLLIVPILTMRTFAEEKKQKTDQLLYSLPAGMLRIVMGKYLALLLVFLVPVIILSTYPLVLSMYGELEMKTVYSTIFVFFLLGASLLAIGIFISTLTESQPFAAGGTFVVLLLDYLSPSLADFLPAGGSIVSALCLFTPLENFLYGIFDIKGIVLYLSTIILFLFLQCRLWRNGGGADEMVVLIPAALLIAGIIMWRRRRKL